MLLLSGWRNRYTVLYDISSWRNEWEGWWRCSRHSRSCIFGYVTIPLPWILNSSASDLGGLDTVGLLVSILNTNSIAYDASFTWKTMSAIMIAFSMLVADPVVQARVQAEMDMVVGKDRLPNFSDRENMPFMQCVISEVIRCVWICTFRHMNAYISPTGGEPRRRLVCHHHYHWRYPKGWQRDGQF